MRPNTATTAPTEIILQIYDAINETMTTGQPYQTHRDPPPVSPECHHPKKKVGILAFGSLIGDPGTEIGPKITMRIKCKTPFGVEYGRLSQTRGGAPTLVPHENGAPVSAEILVLDDSVSEDAARDMLWRRETRNVGTNRHYPAGTGANAIIAAALTDTPCVETVFYTDFNPSGKILNPTAEDLAKSAIASVKEAGNGQDGITYLINNIAAGIETPLTSAYRDAILKQTGEDSLDLALCQSLRV